MKITISTDQGTVAGILVDEDCEEFCDHDGHFSTEYVLEGRGFARSDLADQITRQLQVGVELVEQGN